MERTRIVFITRARSLPDNGCRTLYFMLHVGRRGEFVNPEKLPDFEGEYGWCEAVKRPKAKGGWFFFRQLPPTEITDWMRDFHWTEITRIDRPAGTRKGH